MKDFVKELCLKKEGLLNEQLDKINVSSVVDRGGSPLLVQEQGSFMFRRHARFLLRVSMI